MTTCHLKDLYDPLQQLSFTVYFENDVVPEPQQTKAEKVVEYLTSLSSEKLKEESSKFFKWVVMYPVDTHQVYAEHLLAFFHAQGLLLNKKAVITKSKQHKQRYLVIYDVNGQVFSKIYNSIREIREDTGKKPTKICKYLLPPEHSV